MRCSVQTISDTRTPDTDTSGRAIVELSEATRHRVAVHGIVQDEPADVRDSVTGQINSVDAIVTTGGTSITSRDATCEAIEDLMEKRLAGFGELFRS